MEMVLIGEKANIYLRSGSVVGRGEDIYKFECELDSARRIRFYIQICCMAWWKATLCCWSENVIQGFRTVGGCLCLRWLKSWIQRDKFVP